MDPSALAVLGRRHRACVDVHIRVDFDSRHRVPERLQQQTGRGSYNATRFRRRVHHSSAGRIV